MCVGSNAFAADLTPQLDARHKACLERIAIDADVAYEEAMIWRNQGGGRRARHCQAMALFALGHDSEAANRLDDLTDSRDGGSNAMRLNFRAEAANFWLAAQEPEKALESVEAGLDYDNKNADLHIARARAHVMLGDLDAAEDALSVLLLAHTDHPEALRYRADVRLRQDRFVAAKMDIDASLLADPTSVETALLRGHINEAIRLSDLEPEPADAVQDQPELKTEPELAEPDTAPAK